MTEPSPLPRFAMGYLRSSAAPLAEPLLQASQRAGLIDLPFDDALQLREQHGVQRRVHGAPDVHHVRRPPLGGRHHVRVQPRELLLLSHGLPSFSMNSMNEGR